MSPPLTLAALVAGLALAMEAGAFPRFFATAPTGICQAALPVFEGAIRKRPLAVQNEGAAPAFLTCSLPTQYSDSEQFLWAMLRFRSLTGADLTVTCTGVWGLAGDMRYSTSSVTLPASGATIDLAWDIYPGGWWSYPNENRYFSASCSLPVGAAITEGWQQISDVYPGRYP